MTNEQLIASLTHHARMALIAGLQQETDLDFLDAKEQIDEVTSGETLVQLWARLQATN